VKGDAVYFNGFPVRLEKLGLASANPDQLATVTALKPARWCRLKSRSKQRDVGRLSNLSAGAALFASRAGPLGIIAIAIIIAAHDGR